MSTTISLTPLHISTDAFPPHCRLEMWREVYDSAVASFYGRAGGNLDIELLGNQPFRAGVTLRSFKGLGIASGYRSDARYRRTRDVAAASSDNFMFVVVTDGVGILSQRHREATLGAGEALLMSATEPNINVMHSEGRMLTLSVPRAAIASLLRDTEEDAVMRPISRDRDALRLLVRYVDILQETSAFSDPELAAAAVRHVHDLVALTIGPTPDAMEMARGRGARAARVATIKADIAANIARPELSADMIAQRHGISTRYIHRLFEHDDLSFAEFVLEQRLARAHRMLTDARFADSTIGAIAEKSGFADRSHFNRKVRERYGATPSDLRSLAKRDEGN